MDMEIDENLSLTERRPRRENRQLLKRFGDIVPQPLPLPPPPPVSTIPTNLHPISSPPATSPPASHSLVSYIGRMFQTPRNVFGLLRRYCSDRRPSHDPEENIDLFNLSDYPHNVGSSSETQRDTNQFYPFPNHSSFLLGEWYWNHGVQKSRESFSELLSIIGGTGFSPEDVRRTQWGKIDAELARNDFDETKAERRSGNQDKNHVDSGDDNSDAEWMDEDASWKKTPITISVPFHSRWTKSGPQTYVVGDLYHRSFVSVIREKIANLHDDQHFHYEPFKLFWMPTDKSTEIRVHGELYTSPAFLEAHRDLQNSPKELGCDLERVVVAMMFWSDVTHLTSFGNAKIWPAYLLFGNESKYRRCKPTHNLCNHVAYFQSVCHLFYFSVQNRISDDCRSFQMHLKTSLPIKQGGRHPVSLSWLTVVVKLCMCSGKSCSMMNF